MSLQKKNKKKSSELSFTKKCILFAYIQYETDKILLNSFHYMPIVKLYTASMKQEKFFYTKIKGPLLIFTDKNSDNKRLYFRIYNPNDFSLQFNLEISIETQKNLMQIEQNFYCFNLKFGFIGFHFQSEEDTEIFEKIIDSGELDQQTSDEYESLKIYPLKQTDNIVIYIINNLKQYLRAQYEVMTLGEQLQYSQITQYLIFSGFLELSQLLKNMEFDYEDNIFNIFIDKKFDKKLFNNIFHNLIKSQTYPIRILPHDYLKIYNKSNYVDMLVEHLNNNFKEQVEILKKRKINKVEEKNRVISRNASLKESNENEEEN